MSDYTPLSSNDIKRLVALARSQHTAVQQRALDALRSEREYWRHTTLPEFEDFMIFVWERDPLLGFGLATDCANIPPLKGN